jgi:hypothetical protein
MKKGPLSKEDKKYIDNNKDVSIEQLSKTLDRSINSVSCYVKTNKTTTDNLNLFARNKDRGVVVMTEAASMSADQNKKKPNLEQIGKYKNSICKIRRD